MHNRRRSSARRKLWKITTYKDSEQHISDSDDEEEKKAKCRKKSFAQYYGNNAVENWMSCGSGFDCKQEFEGRDKICDVSHSFEEETLIDATSCSDEENLHSTQLSISEISCNSNKSPCYYMNQHDHQDFHEDSSECSAPTSISDITENSQKNFPSNEKVHNASYTISPPSSPVDSANSNAKGSDWLLKIPWQPSSHKEFCTKTEFDSGKKKKKFISGGFADQLHKLHSREKSAKAFWDHHNHDARSPHCGKESMILQLTETTRNYGTVICRAVIVKELYLFQSSSNCMDSETNLIAKDTSETIPEKYIILLDHDQYEKLSISAGSTVQLFPPWKVLHVANFTEPVLLCTYFLKVMKKDQQFLASCGKRNYQKQDV